ncbi:hypothetical protein SBA1_550122 [Candidatus Sulfotelmatobacter kueseliae]|uniref:Uncharacterized protein n=1 Tax=Candidatus Sulfotelmatobacter kueseliae TaxID=2042962 RepID=A0A2U3KYT4_9BACT|nr:hypothetical protein SBA1_550122 [Candidatus Sulfotelmatobacter kueseliae]
MANTKHKPKPQYQGHTKTWHKAGEPNHKTIRSVPVYWSKTLRRWVTIPEEER